MRYLFSGKGIGPSDIPTILNENPYQTPLQLITKKWHRSPATSPRRPETPSAVRGKRLEGTALRLYNERNGVDYKPTLIICKLRALDFLRASLDGANADVSHFCEIKCPEKIADHQTLPRRYWLQVQAQLLITGLEKADLVSFFPGAGQELMIREIKADVRFHQRDLLPAILDFYLRLVKADGID